MARKFTSDEELAEIVSQSQSVFEVLRKLGLKKSGGSHYHYSNRIKTLGLDTSHFCGQSYNRGKISNRRLTVDQVLILRVEGTRQKSHILTRCLKESGINHCCVICGQLPEWRGNPLTLDVDHINGNWLDDRIENLRFLCPNCHSQFTRNLLAG